MLWLAVGSSSGSSQILLEDIKTVFVVAKLGRCYQYVTICEVIKYIEVQFGIFCIAWCYMFFLTPQHFILV